MKSVRLYVAGKVSKESSFGTHHWREDFCMQLEKLTGMTIVCLDPTRAGIKQDSAETVFGGDAYLIKQCDVFVVYLSDDISVGGSQEMLIATFFKKPIIGLAPKVESLMVGVVNSSEKSSTIIRTHLYMLHVMLLHRISRKWPAR